MISIRLAQLAVNTFVMNNYWQQIIALIAAIQVIYKRNVGLRMMCFGFTECHCFFFQLAKFTPIKILMATSEKSSSQGLLIFDIFEKAVSVRAVWMFQESRSLPMIIILDVSLQTNSWSEFQRYFRGYIP
jgi:hypothetical protein